MVDEGQNVFDVHRGFFLDNLFHCCEPNAPLYILWCGLKSLQSRHNVNFLSFKIKPLGYAIVDQHSF